MEEGRIPPGLARLGGGIVEDRSFGEEHAHHIACELHLVRDPRAGEGLGEQNAEPFAVAIQGGIHLLVGGAQCGQPGRHRHRVPGQRAGLVHRTEWSEPVHHLGPATERGGG